MWKVCILRGRGALLAESRPGVACTCCWVAALHAVWHKRGRRRRKNEGKAINNFSEFFYSRIMAASECINKGAQCAIHDFSFISSSFFLCTHRLLKGFLLLSRMNGNGIMTATSHSVSSQGRQTTQWGMNSNSGLTYSTFLFRLHWRYYSSRP